MINYFGVIITNIFINVGILDINLSEINVSIYLHK